MSQMDKNQVVDPSLAETGRDRLLWARQSMPVLVGIESRFAEEKPFVGLRIAACLHVTTETGVLMQVLAAGGAEVALCASNPLSTQDDVVASLVQHDGISVYAKRGVDRGGYYEHLKQTLAHQPHITMDDGADLVTLLHTEARDKLSHVIGGTEETTTGVVRLRRMAHESMLTYPIIAVNDADTKHMFDNRYGTGQSTIDGILRATNRLLSGSVFVVSGYGWCGRGVAMRASGMGARVIVTEIDPIRALEAVMDGFQVMPMQQAAAIGDTFCTVTGNTCVIDEPHFAAMKDGAIMCNAGHFNTELALENLAAMSTGRRLVREGVEAFIQPDGRRLYVLEEGRLVNLSAAEGHPAAVMDMSFANQALCAAHMVQHAQDMTPGVYAVPLAIDQQVAQRKLESLHIAIDTLTEAQERYLNAWQSGT